MEGLLRTFERLKRGKAADAWGWRNEFIQLLVEVAPSAATALAKWLSTAPFEPNSPVVRYFREGMLLPLQKKTGDPTSIRPVGILPIFRRILSAHVVGQILFEARRLFQATGGHQLSMEISGCPAVAHMVQAALLDAYFDQNGNLRDADAISPADTRVLHTADAANAFQTPHRT